ncbi:MAG: GNAT family N-acetyltransferase [Gammaproteobacteria bacterium]
MSAFTLRAGTAADVDQIVALNAESVAMTSPMDASRFDYLFGISSLMTVVEQNDRVVAFLIAMTDDTEHDSGNFHWFAERLNRFIYVDRVVVSSECRGSGIGSALYDHIQLWAEETCLQSIVAEMNLDPPNVGSLNFHKKRGFVQTGTRVLEDAKIVSMQVLSIQA